jgi:hypothetical protein
MSADSQPLTSDCLSAQEPWIGRLGKKLQQLPAALVDASNTQCHSCADELRSQH